MKKIEEMIILNEYPNSHHYRQRYLKSDIMCIQCMSYKVWDSGLECYIMCQCTMHVCVDCYCHFYVSAPENNLGPREIRIIEQLKTGKIDEPTTKRGN